MSQTKIEDDKLVELKYDIIDKKTEEVLVKVEYPIGYVHGDHSVMSSDVTSALAGHCAGDVIEVPIDCNKLYGARDETLVFTDHLENVPEEYREVGMTITMESESGNHKNFIVTRIDEKSITFDGNNPLSGRQVIFRLEIIDVRDATDDEMEAGGLVDPSLDEILSKES